MFAAERRCTKASKILIERGTDLEVRINKVHNYTESHNSDLYRNNNLFVCIIYVIYIHV